MCRGHVMHCRLDGEPGPQGSVGVSTVPRKSYLVAFTVRNPHEPSSAKDPTAYRLRRGVSGQVTVVSPASSGSGRDTGSLR